MPPSVHQNLEVSGPGGYLGKCLCNTLRRPPGPDPLLPSMMPPVAAAVAATIKEYEAR